MPSGALPERRCCRKPSDRACRPGSRSIKPPTQSFDKTTVLACWPAPAAGCGPPRAGRAEGRCQLADGLNYWPTLFSASSASFSRSLASWRGIWGPSLPWSLSAMSPCTEKNVLLESLQGFSSDEPAFSGNISLEVGDIGPLRAARNQACRHEPCGTNIALSLACAVTGRCAATRTWRARNTHLIAADIECGKRCVAGQSQHAHHPDRVAADVQRNELGVAGQCLCALLVYYPPRGRTGTRVLRGHRAVLADRKWTMHDVLRIRYETRGVSSGFRRPRNRTMPCPSRPR